MTWLYADYGHLSIKLTDSDYKVNTNMAEAKFINTLGKADRIRMRHEVGGDPEIPMDYHCDCPYCQKFLGEIFDPEVNKYYSNRLRKGYYVDKKGDHLDVGHVVGYRWAIQNLCPKGGIVFDPTVGSGTAIVEALNNGRFGIGIELEYPETAQRNIDAQEPEQNNLEGYELIEGNALFTEELLEGRGWIGECVDLIVNGPPYPTNGTLSSDAPEKIMKGQDPNRVTPNYMHPENFGHAKQNGEWEDLISSMYEQAVSFLKPGGYLVILVKDMMRNKKPALLHKETVDLIMAKCPELEYKGFYLHRHVPTTMFMNTYNKRFPDVLIPWYQTCVVLQKPKV